jgi:hypothetical protein
VTIPPRLTREIKPDLHSLIAGYVHPNSKDAQKAIEDYSSLFETSRSILRPVRALLVGHHENEENKHTVIYYAHGNTDKKHWIIRDSFSTDSTPIHNYLTSDQAKTVFRLTLPYFRGTDLAKMTKIITEEQDLLSGLRAELKKIVQDFDEKEQNIEEIQQTILRPEVDKINRHFRHYKNTHRWRVSGSAGLFALSLIKIFIPEFEINNFITSIMAGTGYTGIVLSEREYQAKMNTLRDNPYFLLWRVHRQYNA